MKKALIFLIAMISVAIFSTNVFAEKFTYDELGRLTSVIYENNSKCSYTYDNMGNILKVEIGTTSSDSQAPTAPTNLKTTSILSNTVTLSWTAGTDNIGITGYDVYKNNSKIATVLTTSYTDSAFTVNTNYNYYVVAKDAAGNISAPSNILPVLLDTLPPSAPTNLYITSQTSDSIYLYWSGSVDNVEVTSYDIFWNGEYLGNIVGTGCILSSMQINKLYKFSVKAKDAANNMSAASNEVSVYNGNDVNTDKQPPSTPQNFQLISSTASTASLGWTLSTDNLGVAGYELYGNDSKMNTFNNTTNSCNITGIPANVSCTYYIKAIDFAGNVSAATTAITLLNGVIVDNQAPSIPLDFKMTESTLTTADFSWSPSTDNIGVTEYAVFVNDDNIGTIEGTSCYAYDLAENTILRIYIKAKDAAGNYSQASETISLYNGILVDATEPNDTYESAKLAELGSSFDATIHSDTDVDYYKFNSLYNGKWKITFISPGNFDYDAEIYDQYGNMLWNLNSTNKNEEVEIDVGIETQYLRVIGYEGAFTNLPYTLIFEEIPEGTVASANLSGSVAPTQMGTLSESLDVNTSQKIRTDEKISSGKSTKK